MCIRPPASSKPTSALHRAAQRKPQAIQISAAPLRLRSGQAWSRSSAFAERQDQRAPAAIADGVTLRVQPALGAPDTAGNSPFLKRLAAVRWAFKWVASIINWSGLPPLAAKPAEILLNTPSPTPADETIIDRLVRPVLLGRLAPSQPVPDHEDNPANHPSVIDPRHPLRQRKIRLDPAHLVSTS